MTRVPSASAILFAPIPLSEGWILPLPSPKAKIPTYSRCSTTAAASKVATAASTVNEKSTELLSLLRVGDVSASSSGANVDWTTRINSLVNDLAFPSPSSPPNVYDPSECLYGDLWCTVHTVNFANPDSPSPLWERISLRANNIKGQQYYREGGTEEGYGDVINYSEIFGPAVHLRATGSFRPRAEARDDNREDGASARGQSADKEGKRGFYLGSLISGWTNSQENSRSVSSSVALGRICPDDFTVTVSKGTVAVFGLELDIPIKGTGFLRVLYADDKLRIFISPIETEDTNLRGDWEREGLVVVQIRSDLISSKGGSINLRE